MILQIPVSKVVVAGMPGVEVVTPTNPPSVADNRRVRPPFSFFLSPVPLKSLSLSICACISIKQAQDGALPCVYSYQASSSSPFPSSSPLSLISLSPYSSSLALVLCASSVLLATPQLPPLTPVQWLGPIVVAAHFQLIRATLQPHFNYLPLAQHKLEVFGALGVISVLSRVLLSRVSVKPSTLLWVAAYAAAVPALGRSGRWVGEFAGTLGPEWGAVVAQVVLAAPVVAILFPVSQVERGDAPIV